MTSPHTRDLDASAAETPRTTTDPRRDTRPRWGRSARLGGGTGRLIAVSLLLGTLLAGLLGIIAYGLAALAPDADPRRAPLIGLVLAVIILPVAIAVAWALLVDRDTLRGAVRNTEETVEGRWYTTATSGAFHDLLILAGLGTAVASLAGWDLDASTTGVVLLLAMTLSAAVRYLLMKRRG